MKNKASIVLVIFICLMPNRKSPIKKESGNAYVNIIRELLPPSEKKPRLAKKMYHNKIDFVRCFFTVFPKPEINPEKTEIISKSSNKNSNGK